MRRPKKGLFAKRTSKKDIEHGSVFRPAFDAEGLIPAIVTDAQSGDVLMFAWMNRESLAQSLETGVAHFWSRSRQALWKKGEESGNVLIIREMRTDCDQDVIWVHVSVGGDGVACHTGATSCFYRAVSLVRDESGFHALTPLPQNKPHKG